MRLHIVRELFRKDLLETIRDRRTLVTTLVLPVVLYPLLFLVMGSVASDKRAELDRTVPKLAVWGPMPAQALTALTGGTHATVVDARPRAPADARAEARALVESKRIHAAIVVTSGESGASLPLTVYSDSTQLESEAIGERVARHLEALGARWLEERLVALGQLPAAAHPIDVTEADLSDASKRGASFAGSLLPYLLLVMVATSGFYAAIDVTAGEKERGTLQTLLTAPVRPLEVVAGKYLAVLTLTLIATLANLGSLGLSIARLAALDPAGARFHLDARVVATVFLALFPAALLITGLFLAVGVLARTYKEGQTYLLPLMLVVVFAGMRAMLPGAELTPATAAIPLTNVALLVHDLLLGRASVAATATVLVSSLAYAALAILLAARVFENEQVLLSGEKPWRGLLARTGGRRSSPGAAVVFVALLVVVSYYGSLWLDARHLARTILVTQVGLLLVPALLFCAALRLPLREVLQLRWPTSRGWVATVLIASGAWAVGAVVWSVLLHLEGARDYSRLLGDLLGRQGQLSLPVAILTVALLPAVCEEVCFRGVVLSGLASSGSRTVAVVGSAVAFGLFHLNPYHVLGATVLGLVLGYVAVETGSLVPSILIHFVNNALEVLGERSPALQAVLSSWWLVALGLLMTLVGLWLVSRRGARVWTCPGSARWRSSAPSGPGRR